MKYKINIIALLALVAVMMVVMTGCEAGGDSQTDTNIEPVQVNINLYSGNTQQITTNEFGEVTFPEERSW